MGNQQPRFTWKTVIKMEAVTVVMWTHNFNTDLIKSKTCSGPIYRHAKPPHLVIYLSNFPAKIPNIQMVNELFGQLVKVNADFKPLKKQLFDMNISRGRMNSDR